MVEGRENNRSLLSMRSVWRAQASVQVQDMFTQLDWIASTPDVGLSDAEVQACVRSADELLSRAREIIVSKSTVRDAFTGAGVTAARQYIAAARINLLRIASDGHLLSLLPNMIEEAGRYTPSQDRRLRLLGRFVDPERPRAESSRDGNVKLLNRTDRLAIISAVQGLQEEAGAAQLRIRGFRNIIVGVTSATAVLAVLIALLSIALPSLLNICFAGVDAPGSSAPPLICPTGTSEIKSPLDIALIEFLGLVGASVAAAISLRDARGSSDPYSLPVALAMLKLPLGAITAIVGLMLLQANLVPALRADIDSSSQIVALGLLLGYSQQLFTGLIDRQASTVLSEGGDLK